MFGGDGDAYCGRYLEAGNLMLHRKVLNYKKLAVFSSKQKARAVSCRVILLSVSLLVAMEKVHV